MLPNMSFLQLSADKVSVPYTDAANFTVHVLCYDMIDRIYGRFIRFVAVPYLYKLHVTFNMKHYIIKEFSNMFPCRIIIHTRKRSRDLSTLFYATNLF